jgi:hypothetical protein
MTAISLLLTPHVTQVVAVLQRTQLTWQQALISTTVTPWSQLRVPHATHAQVSPSDNILLFTSAFRFIVQRSFVVEWEFDLYVIYDLLKWWFQVHYICVVRGGENILNDCAIVVKFFELDVRLVVLSCLLL